MNAEVAGFLRDYLLLRRLMGHALSRHEQLIGSFLTSTDAAGDMVITVDAAVTWACAGPGTSPRWRAARLAALRPFARYLHDLDPTLAQLIPAGLIPARLVRGLPYIYTDSQITSLMDAALLLRPALRGLTVSCVIGLMAATGMRISEALALTTADVDLGAGMLTVTGKRANQRLVPVHATTSAALRAYLRSSRMLTVVTEDAFFVNTLGGGPHPTGVERAFREVTTTLGYGARPGGKPPRLHDLRHSFATRALIRAYQEGVDVDRRVTLLATYLGHVSPASTYWYLTATPELLELSAARVLAAQQGEVLLP